MSGGRIVPLGTGRVKSQIKMQARVAFAASAANGGAAHGLRQRRRHGLRRVGEQRHRLLGDHGDVESVGQIDRPLAPPVVQVNAHGPTSCRCN